MRYEEIYENSERTPNGVRRRLKRYLWVKFRELAKDSVEIEASELRNRYEVNRFCFSVSGNYSELEELYQSMLALLKIEGCDIKIDKNRFEISNPNIGPERGVIEKPYHHPYNEDEGTIQIMI